MNCVQRHIEWVRRTSERAVAMHAQHRSARRVLFNHEQHDEPMKYDLR
jgi:hypothetical protein